MSVNKLSILFLRFALAGSYLSAVADRFGLWGKAGEPGVVWGNFDAFLAYTQYLNPWATFQISSFLGYAATALEIVLGLFLIIGFKIKITSLASCLLLLSFAAAMILNGGFKGPFDYSVFTAAAASLLLFSVSEASKSKSKGQ